MKVFFYCQHILGIGHFFRSFEIARALSPHEVLFVEGGEPFQNIPSPPHVRRFFLPPLMMDEAFERFNLEGDELVSVQNERKEKLLRAYDEFSPDVVIIELFPFGRKKFSFELIPLLERIRTGSPKTLTVCSLRDILVEKKDRESYELRVTKILNKYFDLVLIHSDERIFTLEESFFRSDDIKIPVYYTGFVARSSSRPGSPGTHDGRRKIVVSTGGGKVGSELIEAAILAILEVPDSSLIMEVYVGPFMEDSRRRELEAIAREDERIQFKPFAPDFIDVLSQADISISMAGYNTVMDLICTGTYGILYPFKRNREQQLRAERLARFGRFVVINEAKPEIIRREIQRGLDQVSHITSKKELPDAINLNGAQRTKEILEAELQKRILSVH
jgi:predicted glycosyltransferase